MCLIVNNIKLILLTMFYILARKARDEKYK